MAYLKAQLSSWENPIYLKFDDAGDLRVADRIVLQVDNSIESAILLEILNDNEFTSVPDKDKANSNYQSISFLRKATADDLSKRITEEEKKNATQICKKLIKNHKLPMKLVDLNFSLDRSRAVFAFIADGRVDFRELVRELTRELNKTIRLQQIGIRDEAKNYGDYGHCGRELCCKKFLGDLSSITSDMAEQQQCSHRGSDRISGVCGRLMCCLAFEDVGYKELAKKMPPIGARVNVDGDRGVVIGHHVLKQSVNVEFKDNKGGRSNRVEVDLNRHKNKK